MLHILNGDCSAQIWRNTGIAGELCVWREALVDGPTPDKTPAEWFPLRANYHAATAGISETQCRQDLLEQFYQVLSGKDHDEVVLWFEDDLFCHINLIYLLSLYAHNTPAHISLVFQSDANKRGLGHLTVEEMAQLFPQRTVLNTQQLDLADMAWQAYIAAQPDDLVTLSHADTKLLPFLSQTLKEHLGRFPAIGNGLGRPQKILLEILNGATGHQTFGQIWPKFSARAGHYGFGDLQVVQILKQMSNCAAPLVDVADDDKGMLQVQYAITDLGRTVCADKEDFLHYNQLDCWLGGVHLVGNDLPRWNESTSSFV